MSPTFTLLSTLLALLPVLLMLAVLPHRRDGDAAAAWRRFRGLSFAALVAALAGLVLPLAYAPAPGPAAPLPGLAVTTAGAAVALLVQFLGTVIGGFSSRYLEGERDQPRYVAALGGVLAAVHLLLLADHWVLLIAAWAAIGWALQPLLCFYAERPFARLAAAKKRLADRAADALLIAAAALSWNEVGSGSLSALWRHLGEGPTSPALQAAALCLVGAVVLRCALLPLHGWLLQVMEAPTPVSALLHAGVVNLGGFVLVRFAPLLEAAPLARWLLVAAGLASAVLAGLALLTRVSIKLRLAWSTVAQMGFMLMQCGLGLYTLALLHLLGHSLYKAHAFLRAGSAVEDTRRRLMGSPMRPASASLMAAPLLAAALVTGTVALVAPLLPEPAWPAWWSGVLALAWAPLLWLPASSASRDGGRALLAGGTMVVALVLAALVGHALPWGVVDAPHTGAGLVALAGLAGLYVALALLQARPHWLEGWRRRAYAGFYLDEPVTRVALRTRPLHTTPLRESAQAAR